MKKQQGFTLIELMIAVAIVGILAAVAIPQYQNYIARSQASEAVSLLSGLKTPVVEHYSINGAFPGVGSTSNADKLENLVLSGEYVASINGDGGATGAYVATFENTTGINARLKGQAVTMTFNADGSIECSTTTAAKIGDLMPANCVVK